MPYSKSYLDKVGRLLAKNSFDDETERDRCHAVLDEYRQDHIGPLTEATLCLQGWMEQFDEKYYIAQRLKRRPQIIRKLSRFSVRLSQLQDVGGARIVVSTNAIADRLESYLKAKVNNSQKISIDRIDDYRILGREDSGYRSLHLILRVDNAVQIELQVRSEAQHYWAETIERTSVIYGHHLKELEGAREVLQYFRILSDVFYEWEAHREPSVSKRIELERSREEAERCIQISDPRRILNSSINEGVVKAMMGRQQGRRSGINNWILVFDWNRGTFVHFEPVDRAPHLAMKSYTEKESQFLADDGFEVVMVGSSDPSMIRHTHSHYFGLQSYDKVLETLGESIGGITRRLPIPPDSSSILKVLVRRGNWSDRRMVSKSTLKNHLCQNVTDFETGLDWLIQNNLMLKSGKSGLHLNIDLRTEIEKFGVA